MRIRANSLLFSTSEIDRILDRAVEIHTGRGNTRGRKSIIATGEEDDESEDSECESESEGKHVLVSP